MLAGHLVGGPHGLLIGLILGGLGNVLAYRYSESLALMAMRRHVSRAVTTVRKAG
jgi:hypothetical protein